MSAACKSGGMTCGSYRGEDDGEKNVFKMVDTSNFVVASCPTESIYEVHHWESKEHPGVVTTGPPIDELSTPGCNASGTPLRMYGPVETPCYVGGNVVNSIVSPDGRENDDIWSHYKSSP